MSNEKGNIQKDIEGLAHQISRTESITDSLFTSLEPITKVEPQELPENKKVAMPTAPATLSGCTSPLSDNLNSLSLKVSKIADRLSNILSTIDL
jgi:hypothetical protein